MTTKSPNNAMILKSGSVTGIRAHDLSEQSKAGGSEISKL